MRDEETQRSKETIPSNLLCFPTYLILTFSHYVKRTPKALKIQKWASDPRIPCVSTTCPSIIGFSFLFSFFHLNPRASRVRSKKIPQYREFCAGCFVRFVLSKVGPPSLTTLPHEASKANGNMCCKL